MVEWDCMVAFDSLCMVDCMVPSETPLLLDEKLDVELKPEIVSPGREIPIPSGLILMPIPLATC